MSKIKNGGLDQCGAEPFEEQQFGIAGVEGVKVYTGLQWSELLAYVRAIISDATSHAAE